MSDPHPITADFAAYAAATRFDLLPEPVQKESVRAFLNWLGCALGGSRELVAVRAASVAAKAGAPQSRLIGHGARADIAGAAFVNCVSSSALAFDDTHLATVTHPTGPVAAALWAQAEVLPVSGPEFLSALALGVEIQCRLSNVLLLPPAKPNLSLYITGITGPIGTAVAMGRLLRLEERQLCWALGLAATQAAGFRATHGSMAGLVVPGFGARAGVWATQLAAAGVDCTDTALEAARGFIDIFTTGANPAMATAGLGHQFEMLANTYKPYPAGIVIHAAIDACLDVAALMPPKAQLARVQVRVNPLTLALTDRRQPASSLDAQISLHHWVAFVLLGRVAGTLALSPEAVFDPAIAALRERIVVEEDARLARDEAEVEVDLADGRRLHAHVPHARGSLSRPMTDAELQAKFMAQARLAMPEDRAKALLSGLLKLPESDDVAASLGPLLDDARPHLVRSAAEAKGLGGMVAKECC